MFKNQNKIYNILNVELDICYGLCWFNFLEVALGPLVSKPFVVRKKNVELDNKNIKKET